ncbi:chromosomal replication initiator protein DnaA [Humitalea sp. 24SJ18S-53]|uniref:chromosomal replication initiator protein DnaA n=1 Tax=Humitalea sp. 24SJ18S-53 TaxID=3422307 RepID=UPI003D67BC97
MAGGHDGGTAEAPARAEGATLSAGALTEAWARIRGRLRQEVGDAEYRSWLRQMTLAGIAGDVAVVLLPSRFLRDWVRSHYADRLRTLWQAEGLGVRRIEVRVAPDAPGEAAAAAQEASSAAPAPGLAGRLGAAAPAGERLVVPPVEVAELPAPATANGAAPSQDPSLDPRFTFDTFVVGKPNEFANAAARRVSERPASVGFNPLFLYGGVGLGKTHLMHAIAWAIRENHPASTVTYMSAETFMYRFIGALRRQNTMEFKESLRSVDVLMIDDLQFLIGKDNTQEEFFHTFNALVEAGKQIVVSADKSPSDLSGLEDRLRTRLGCGMVADIHATTYELRISILQAKAASLHATVPPRVMEFLASKITGNVRELEGALNRLVAHANLFGRAINLDQTQEVLHDILRAHDRRVTIHEIQKKVSDHYSIKMTDMASPRRARNIARPRQVAMYLAKQLTSRSLPEIGRHFGNRDHTTVMHAVSRITELMQADSSFAEDVDLLKKMLEV